MPNREPKPSDVTRYERSDRIASSLTYWAWGDLSRLLIAYGFVVGDEPEWPYENYLADLFDEDRYIPQVIELARFVAG